MSCKFHLVCWDKHSGGVPFDESYTSYEALALKVHSLLYYHLSGEGLSWSCVRRQPGAIQVLRHYSIISKEIVLSLSVFTATHKPLNIMALYDKGHELYLADRKIRWGRYFRPYVFREGPVAGIHKGHGYRYFRRIATKQERTAVVGVLREEGEPVFRGGRRKLPNSWDDIGRTIQRSWKEHGKGAKAWSRKACRKK